MVTWERTTWSIEAKKPAPQRWALDKRRAEPAAQPAISWQRRWSGFAVRGEGRPLRGELEDIRQ
jgi:hypothetical protein